MATLHPVPVEGSSPRDTDPNSNPNPNPNPNPTNDPWVPAVNHDSSTQPIHPSSTVSAASPATALDDHLAQPDSTQLYPSHQPYLQPSATSIAPAATALGEADAEQAAGAAAAARLATSPTLPIVASPTSAAAALGTAATSGTTPPMHHQQQQLPHQPQPPPQHQQPQQQRSGQNSPGSKIFVGGLSWETNEDSLRRYFEQIGVVLDCVIMRDRHTGHPRGFGFVTFADDDAAGIAASRRHDLDGRQVEAKRAVPRNEGGQQAPAQQAPFGARQQRYGEPAPTHRHHTTKCKVFVGGLPSGCGVDEFRTYFSQFGEVVEAQVMIDHNTGNSRGFGFVTFGSEATVNAVVGPGKSNTDHEIMGKCVEVKRAEPKGASSDRRGNRDGYGGGAGGGGVGGMGGMGGGGGMRGQAMGGGGGMGGAGGPGGGVVGVGGGVGGASGAVAGGAGNDPMAGGSMNGGGTTAAAAAAAAYYSNYPQSLAEQYSAYYNNPQQWQQYYAAMGYNFNAFQQAGYNPYQQYLQAYMNSTQPNAGTGGSGGGGGAGAGGAGGGNNGAGGGGGGGGGGVPGGGMGGPGGGDPRERMPSNGPNDGRLGGMPGGGGGGYDHGSVASGRYGAGGGNMPGPQNGHGANDGPGPSGRRSSRRDDRYHPYR